MAFPIQKLGMILTLLELTYFEENFVNLRKITFRGSIKCNPASKFTLKSKFWPSFEIGLPHISGTSREKLFLEVKKRGENVLIEISSLSHLSQYFREK